MALVLAGGGMRLLSVLLDPVNRLTFSVVASGFKEYRVGALVRIRAKLAEPWRPDSIYLCLLLKPSYESLRRQLPAG